MKRAVLLFLLFSVLIPACTRPGVYRRANLYPSSKRRNVIYTAEKYLGVKYRYGGVTPRGFDCSGLVMYVFRRNGFKMPRALKRQFYSGKRISLRRARPGDLVFFNTSGHRISHVGIYVGNYKFIHAPRTGRRVSYADMRKKYWRKRYIGTVTYFM